LLLREQGCWTICFLLYEAGAKEEKSRFLRFAAEWKYKENCGMNREEAAEWKYKSC